MGNRHYAIAFRLPGLGVFAHVGKYPSHRAAMAAMRVRVPALKARYPSLRDARFFPFETEAT